MEEGPPVSPLPLVMTHLTGVITAIRAARVYAEANLTIIMIIVLQRKSVAITIAIDN